MALKLANNAITKLAVAIGTTDISITVTAGDGAKFPTLAAGDWFPLTLANSSGAIEIVKCTARNGDTMTVTRSQEATVAATFAIGDKVELRLTLAALQSMIDATTTAQTAADNAQSTANGKLDATAKAVSATTADELGSMAANKFLQGADVWTDGVFTGGTIATSATLQGTIAAALAIVTGDRVATSNAVENFAANSDTYVDLKNDGTFALLAVANNTAAPAITANAIRIAKVVTNASAITAVTDMRPQPTNPANTGINALKWGGGIRTTSTAAPSGGNDGDVWFQYS